MNTTQKILRSFTPAQKEEFEADLKKMAEMIAEQLKGKPDKVAETKTNMRLQSNVYLHAMVIFHRTLDDTFSAAVEELKQYKNIDEYLDAMNAARNPSEGFTKLK